MFAAALGWIGTVGTMGAYVMLTRGRWQATSVRYGVLNLLGGLLGAAGSTAYGAWPSVASNLVWAGVSLHSVLHTLRARREVTVVALEPAARIEPDPWPDTLKLPAVSAA